MKDLNLPLISDFKHFKELGCGGRYRSPLMSCKDDMTSPSLGKVFTQGNVSPSSLVAAQMRGSCATAHPMLPVLKRGSGLVGDSAKKPESKFSNGSVGGLKELGRL